MRGIGLLQTALIEGDSGLDTLALGLIWYVVFLFSTTFHELSHAFAAMKLGDRTAYHGGQVTLNPAPHMQREPFGMIVVPLLSFAFSGWMMGWASVPYDPYWAQRYPKRAALMTLAGPGSNLLLVVVAGIMIHVGIAAGLFFAPESVGLTSIVESHFDGFPKGLAVMVSIMFALNLLLFVFNLIPVTPLDGTALMEFVLNEDALDKYRAVMSQPSLRIFGILIAWYLLDVIFPPIHSLAINLLYPGSHYG